MTLMTAIEPAVQSRADNACSNSRRGVVAVPPYLDPLDDDEPSDEPVVTTRRAISRVALVAAEAANRFQRESLTHDPMTWMMAPRALFGGRSALVACLNREDCMRGILLHGLSMGLDAWPEEVDALVDGDDNGDDEEDNDLDDVLWHRDGSRSTTSAPRGGSSNGSDGGEPFDDVQRGDLRLFTATVVANDGFEVVQAFHASLATDEAQIAGRLYMRMGGAMADAVIIEGFDPRLPLVESLVAPALCETLALVAADPFSPLATGLDLNVEQRFLS